MIAESIGKALSEIKNSSNDIGKQMFVVSMAILNHRQVSASECAFRLCRLKMRHSTRKCVFVNNCFPCDRYRMLRVDSGTPFDNIFDKYQSRPHDLENLSLDEFAVRYESDTKIAKARQDRCVDDVGTDSEGEMNIPPEKPKYITLLNGKGRLKVRNRPAVLRTRYFSRDANKEEYYYGLLVCHIPFREESSILMGYNSSYEAFFAKQHQLKPIGNMSIENFANIEREIHDAIRKIVAEKITANIEKVDDNVNLNIDQDILIRVPAANGNIMETDLQELEKHRMSNDDYIKYVSSLNIQQKKLFSNVSKVLTDENPKQFLQFITGGARSGKTFVLKLIVEHIYRLSDHSHPGSDPVAVAAPTGVAAKHVGGRTLCSLFGLPIERGPGGSCGGLRSFTGDRLNHERAKWKHIKWLIIDEISMVSYRVLRMINCRLQELKQSNELYGGINVLLFGDLMQLPPVSKTSNSSYCFQQPPEMAGEVHLWQCFNFTELSSNMRQQGDPTFIDLLNNLRVGQLNMEQLQILDDLRSLSDTENFCHAIRVFPTRKQVDEYNDKIINEKRRSTEVFIINAEDRSTESKTFGQHPDEKYIPTDPDRTAGILKFLEIGLGFRVMLRRNISVQNGLVNGSIGTITHIKWPHLRDMQLEEGELPESVSIKFDDIEEEVVIKPQNFSFDGLKGYGKIERRMLPIILCWAVTVHKLQGITLDKAVVCLGSKLFAKGQAYIALSRVRSLDGLAISELNANKVLSNPHDANCLHELERLRSKILYFL